MGEPGQGLQGFGNDAMRRLTCGRRDKTDTAGIMVEARIDQGWAIPEWISGEPSPHGHAAAGRSGNRGKTGLLPGAMPGLTKSSLKMFHRSLYTPNAFNALHCKGPFLHVERHPATFLRGKVDKRGYVYLYMDMYFYAFA
jgi:hypothetical protein